MLEHVSFTLGLRFEAVTPDASLSVLARLSLYPASDILDEASFDVPKEPLSKVYHMLYRKAGGSFRAGLWQRELGYFPTVP